MVETDKGEASNHTYLVLSRVQRQDLTWNRSNEHLVPHFTGGRDDKMMMREGLWARIERAAHLTLEAKPVP